MLSSAVLVLAAAMIGQSDGEKTFNSYAAFLVGGVWTSDVPGLRMEHTYSRILNDQFVRLDIKGGGPAMMLLIGVDPQTKECALWAFSGDGAVGRFTITTEAEGAFLIQGEGNGPEGKSTQKYRLVRRDPDTAELQVVERLLNGQKQPVGTGTWKRQR